MIWYKMWCIISVDKAKGSDEMPTKFGWLAELRKALRMDLEQLAAASGVPLSTLCKISSGHKISARRQPCGTKERKRSEK